MAEETSAVQVAVRVRPLSAGECAQGSEACATVLGERTVLVGGVNGKQYEFDAAYASTSEQSQVYHGLVAPMVERFFDGYNATVFAYGQTGSGKTYTMGNEFKLSAEPESRGIIPRTMSEIFKRIADDASGKQYVLKISYLEILNEEIHDLLASTPSLATTALSVRDDGKRGVCVNGLSEHPVQSIVEVASLLHNGALNRATASTNMNAQSSRSHAICTLTMEQFETSAECGMEARYSKFHLVDLAGSERAKRTNAEGARFKEGVNINKGLLSLGNVINALSEKSSHVPYRDSKLTRLLQDSLGGNSKTLMVACISPADINFDETCNTLRYASRARKIQNQAVINQSMSAENQVLYLKQQLEVMQLQLLQQSKGGFGASSSGTSSSVDLRPLEKEVEKWRSIAKTREEELQLVMSAKNKWKQIADEFVGKTKPNGAFRGQTTTDSPKSKLLIQEAIEFEKSVQIAKFPTTPGKPEGTSDDISASNGLDLDLQSLEDLISEKEKIVESLSKATGPLRDSSSSPLAALAEGYESKIRQLESEVAKLTAEKARLAQEVPPDGTTQTSDGTQRRLQEQLQLVQTQLQVARHSEKECKRLNQLWKNGSLKISTLQREITDMKAQKAALQRRLKQEAESHRKERREQDLKIIQLKRQEQRKQYELQKLASLHAKQNNVLKRKNEEIAAVTKRMRTFANQKKQVEQQRSISKQRTQLLHRSGQSVARDVARKQTDPLSCAGDAESLEEIVKVLHKAIDIQMTIAGARNAIQHELEDRKQLALEISKREASDEASPDLGELKEKLRTRNSEIRLLQQKLASVERNNSLPPQLLPSKTSLCHQLIKQMFEFTVESKSSALELDHCKNDLEAAEKQLVEQAHRHEDILAEYKKQLSRFQNGDSSRTDSSIDETYDLKRELDEARLELSRLREQASSVSSVASEARVNPPKKPAPKRKPQESVEMVDIMSSSEDDDEEEDDDSDYVEDEKPVRQRKLQRASSGANPRQPLQSRQMNEPSSVMDEIDELLTKPSTVVGTICCSCNGKCATKSCACRAEKQSCGPECSCKETKCLNREGIFQKVSTKQSQSTDQDKENEVNSFFDFTDKENQEPQSSNATTQHVGNERMDSGHKFKKLWSGNKTTGGDGNFKPKSASSSFFYQATSSKTASSNSNSHTSTAIARFF
ncbi:hypothetical protein Poli38472_009074 [Pythium oligandrum]|uniref:Kinesin motor domain-containing protein n=1 Tax=Pythium oligandrum TaxID=41045 RepID=A0A8K1FMI7_PYTOL|nr:hypothetical protein Poli38472_009074 [Pythium oligandrum]|eukprot:TMW64907.1 hypothetical protein Poli38472_009074 [Pythium oligandrum]